MATRQARLGASGSGEATRNDWTNLDRLAPHDELKFVINDRADYDFARQVIDLLRNEELRQRLTRTGYDLVREQYDWSVVHQRVEEAYESIRKRAFRQRVDTVHQRRRDPLMAELR